ncbi:MAG: signal peptidase I [Candidatus Paceibacterota bacterium]|jgi:signal peptidase I
MNKKLFIIFVALLAILIYLNLGELSFDNDIKSADCLISVKEMIVRGNSFSPYINPDTKIKALFNYYDCHEIKRGDIVLFNYAGNKNPLLKVVKGVPGDKFELREAEGGWNIVINNKIVKNFEGQPYLISGNRYKMLALYEKDYNGTIPKNAYLLLSNQVGGSIDSTRFGLVDKNGIIAKVEI